MEDIAQFLLQLYRASRECAPEDFQAVVLDRLQQSFAFASAFWGAGRFTDHGRQVVPTALHSHRLDPAFLADWSQVQHFDPIPGPLLASPGTALRVEIPSYYAPTPVLADLGARYRLRSMTVIAMASGEPGTIDWLSLYRDRADDLCSDRDGRWLEAVAPHLAEAARINRRLGAAVADPDDGRPEGTATAVAVAEAASGVLLCAEDAFLAAISREWSGFDGRRLPFVLRTRWHEAPRFAYVSREGRIDGRRSETLVYLSARAIRETGPLTVRQRQVARLFADGLSSKQIARHCGLAPATVRNHLAAIYGVLGVHDRSELGRRLTKLGPST